jgi:hypothetical protein
MVPRDKLIFPAWEVGAMKWADEGGRFVISLPSVIYNGKTQRTEPFRINIVTDSSYEVFVADKKAVYYHGSYRCIKRVPMDWEVLASLGQTVSTELRACEIHFLTRWKVRGIFLGQSRSPEEISHPSHRVPRSTHV